MSQNGEQVAEQANQNATQEAGGGPQEPSRADVRIQGLLERTKALEQQLGERDRMLTLVLERPQAAVTQEPGPDPNDPDAVFAHEIDRLKRQNQEIMVRIERQERDAKRSVALQAALAGLTFESRFSGLVAEQLSLAFERGQDLRTKALELHATFYPNGVVEPHDPQKYARSKAADRKATAEVPPATPAPASPPPAPPKVEKPESKAEIWQRIKQKAAEKLQAKA